MARGKCLHDHEPIGGIVKVWTCMVCRAKPTFTAFTSVYTCHAMHCGRDRNAPMSPESWRTKYVSTAGLRIKKMR